MKIYFVGDITSERGKHVFRKSVSDSNVGILISYFDTTQNSLDKFIKLKNKTIAKEKRKIKNERNSK